MLSGPNKIWTDCFTQNDTRALPLINCKRSSSNGARRYASNFLLRGHVDAFAVFQFPVPAMAALVVANTVPGHYPF